MPGGLVDSHRAVRQHIRWWARARASYTDWRRMVSARRRSIDRNSTQIIFPFYHYVFPDERLAFERQLAYMRNYGDYLSLDDALKVIASPNRSRRDRFFCLTFDDGIASCYQHAFPILAEKNVPATFFIIADYTEHIAAGQVRHAAAMPGLKFSVEYVTWDECREMQENGMTIGSHTCSHRRLSELDDIDALTEMRNSKALIERELGRACDHFASPWGRPNIDYRRGKHEVMARNLGYRSFSAVARGGMNYGESPYFVKRDFLYAHWDVRLLDFYFGR